MFWKYSFSAFIFLLVVSFICVSFPLSASAWTYYSGKDFIIPKNKIVQDTLAISSSYIVIDGGIKGDLLCTAQTVEVTGTVDGDILCAAQHISVQGVVTGNIRVLAQQTELSGLVMRNVMVGSQQLSSQAQIQGELQFLTQSAYIKGIIKRGVSGIAESAEIGSKIDGQVRIINKSLHISKAAAITGNLQYESPQKAKIATTSAIQGKVIYTKSSDEMGKVRQKAFWEERTVNKFLEIVTFFILGLVLASLLSKKLLRLSLIMEKSVWKTCGIGLLFVIAVIGCIILSALTIVGIPFGIFIAILFLILLLLAPLLTASVLGRKLLENYWVKKKTSLFWIMTSGVVLLWVIFLFPILGQLVYFFAVVFGLGGWCLLVRR